MSTVQLSNLVKVNELKMSKGIANHKKIVRIEIPRPSMKVEVGKMYGQKSRKTLFYLLLHLKNMIFFLLI